jgi:glutamate/tyrosine decarboxylase-like PLP-dependent enzyme
MARVLNPNDSKYKAITSGCAKMHLADSITGDGHKLLNVPYDCGFFFSRHLNTAFEVFQNQGAAYLATAGGDDGIQSPMHIGLENSRRFRALPVYASLVAYGRTGYREMLERQIALARRIAEYIDASSHYQLLPVNNNSDSIFIIVLFRAYDGQLAKTLVKRINSTKKVYVSGTEWSNLPACRFAVSNWQVDVERDFRIIEGVLEEVYSTHIMENGS